jgi:spore germination protein KC
MANKYIGSRILALIVITILLAASITGCWSSNEINDLAIINMMGVDLNEKGEYEVTILIVNSSEVFSQSSIGGGGKPGGRIAIVETATGRSIFEALETLSTTISKRIYYGHMEVTVFGERLAREKMESSLDFFRRENEFRPNLELFVTKGLAKDILTVEPQLENTLGTEVLRIMESSRYASMTMVNDLSQFLDALSSDTKDPMTAHISLASEHGVEIAGQGSSLNKQKDNESGPTSYSIRGSGVFKEGRLRGWLDDEETRGVLWVRGEVEKGVLILRCPGDEKGTISIRTGTNKSQLKPKIVGNHPEITVDVTLDAYIREIECPEFELNAEQIELLNNRLSEEVRQEIEHVLNKLQREWQVDPFGFGEAIYRDDPQAWKRLAPAWRKGGLKNLNVNVKVKANIVRSGLIDNPVKADEGR